MIVNIGEKIRTLRINKGIKQKELAKALYVSVQAVSKWENGKSAPDIRLLPEIANILNVSISDLFD